MTRRLIIILALLLAHAAIAQSYFRRSVNFRDSANIKYLYGTELGSVLLHGYLDGKLKAYTFDIKTEDVKWKPIPAEMIPSAWDPKMDYYYGDRVAYKGKYYECAIDFTQATPGESDPWWEIALKGEPVSTIYSFPTEADTTSKQEFLRKFIQYEDAFPGDPWETTYNYYISDIVEFNGLFYECLIDHLNQQPGKETEYWRIRPQRILFYTPRDLYSATILYARNGADGSTLTPQLLSLHTIDDMEGMLKQTGLHFKFQDVMSFLSLQSELPIVTRSQLGYTGTPQLLIAEQNAYGMLQFLQKNLNEGKLKPAKKGILSMEYETFISTPINDISVNWVLTQDLNTNDLLVTALHYSPAGANYAPAVRLAWKNVEPLLVAEVPAPRTWGFMEGLQSNLYNAFTDTLTFDTLQAMTYTPVVIPTPSEKYFIEQRTANLAGNPKFAQAMESLWSQLRPAILSGQVDLQPFEERPFLCDQPFPAVGISGRLEWKFDAGIRLEHRDEIKMDSMHAQLPVGGIIAEYRRVVAQSSKGQPFGVQRLAVRLFDPQSQSYFAYFLIWDDVRRVARSEDVEELLQAIEKGKLVFDSQNFVDGVMGRMR